METFRAIVIFPIKVVSKHFPYIYKIHTNFHTHYYSHTYNINNNVKDTNYFTNFFYKRLVWWVIIDKWKSNINGEFK